MSIDQSLNSSGLGCTVWRNYFSKWVGLNCMETKQTVGPTLCKYLPQNQTLLPDPTTRAGNKEKTSTSCSLHVDLTSATCHGSSHSCTLDPAITWEKRRKDCQGCPWQKTKGKKRKQEKRRETKHTETVLFKSFTRW